MLTDLDLNLLHALHALLTEQHVTRAGRKVGLSQPAMSAALARLRRYFDDELLARAGNRYQLTPLAEELLEPLDQVMTLVTETLAARRPFDPATSRRELCLQLSDYALAVLLGPLLRAAAAEAPGVRLRFTGVDRADEAAPVADLVIAPPMLPGVSATTALWSDPWVVAVDRSHPGVDDQLTFEQLGELTYVRFQSGELTSPADAHLARLGVDLQVGATVPSFTSALFLVRGTDWFTLVPRRLADRSADTSVRILAPPVALPPLEEHLVGGRRTGDGGLSWLRHLVVRVAAGL